VRGIATAGHCSNSQSDDGASLTYQAGYEGTHGDFQWHTGPQAETDDFYSGNATTLEVNRRDVSAVGAPVVGGSLCKNGKTTFKYCEQVRRLNICFDVLCNLIEMETRSVQGGDSGGSVFYGNTAYGLVYGYHYAPFPPFDRDLYSRADRIDNALNIFIATS
jgi:V8-like Glu-specific endopeptidase